MLKTAASVLLAMVLAALVVRLAAVGILTLIVLGMLKAMWRSS